MHPTLLDLLQGGLGSLASYLAAHVLLCLLPAFLVAGAMTVLLPKEAITRFLGRNARRTVSYPAAAAAGSLLAVCSCTIIPLFAGIYKKGAGLGPAVTFLFFAPAANILALAYTGTVLGADLALARLLLSLAFGIGIGLIMALVFRNDDARHDAAADGLFAGGKGIGRPALLFLVLLVALLLVGTLKLPALAATYARFTIGVPGIAAFQDALDRAVPFDATRGEEGVSVQGALLIVLLALIGIAAWRGLSRTVQGINWWTKLAAALVAATLLAAAAGIVPGPVPDTIVLGLNGRMLGVGAVLAALSMIATRRLAAHETEEWLRESWRFVRQIFPLLVAGVFLVGVTRELIRPEWIEALAGENTILGNLAGVVFGVFMYFPTLVEVPIANMFLDLGMHRGPLLAYLMADPELSLQSVLALSTIIGRRKAWTYVGWVALFSTAAGITFGAWIDGASAALLAAAVLAMLAALAVLLHTLDRRRMARHMPPGS